MPGINETILRPLNSIAERSTLIPLSFSTDGSGVPTLDLDYGGRVTVALTATDRYTITMPSAREIVACVSPSDSSVNYTVVKDADAGTVVIDFGANFFSKRCDVHVTLIDSETNT